MRWSILLLLYAILCAASWGLAFAIRFDGVIPSVYRGLFWQSLPWVVVLKLLLLSAFGQFNSLLTFFSLPEAKRLVIAMFMAAALLLTAWYVGPAEQLPPRGVILVDFFTSCIALGLARTGMRLYREKSSLDPKERMPGLRRVAIIGAGSAGAALLREIKSKPGLGMSVQCFVDDDRDKIGNTIHGKRVDGPIGRIAAIKEAYDLNKAIIAMPQASPLTIKKTVEHLNACGLEHDILPSMSQLLHKRVSVSLLRHVDPEDLLGRESVELQVNSIAELINGETVLVTGAGGSIGSELCRQIAALGPSRFVMVERSEPGLFAIEQEIKTDFPQLEVKPITASVCNKERLENVFCFHRPSLVFHAAAHKHVPLMESQPQEAILNNCLGSLNVAELAVAHGCRRAILVSTDKAVNPTNVMGATKRVAELIWMQLNREQIAGCRFSSVRFGNVLGSSGSVIPTFRRQISIGGPVTVTHPEITRYFMSIPEAVGLILQSAAQSMGGEIFVLEMGEAVKILDLARQMISLSGFEPEIDIQIVFTGLRPGEKLYEEPIHKAENVDPTSHPKIYRLTSKDEVKDTVAALNSIKQTLCRMQSQQLKDWLKQQVPEYGPEIKRA